MFGNSKITGGLGGGLPKSTKTTGGLSFGNKTTTPTASKPTTSSTFSATSKAPAVSAAPAAAAAGSKLPATTDKKKATDTKITVIIDEKEVDANIKNVAALPEFDKKFTPEELRFYDYVDQKKIETKAKPSSGSVIGSITETAQKIATTPAAGGSLGKIAGNDSSAEQKKNIKYDNLNVPEPKKVKPISANEFFKSIKSMKRGKEDEEKLFLSGKCSKDYSTYFVSKTSALSDPEGYRCNSVKPVKFTAEMLNFITPAKPEKESFDKHEITQRLRCEPRLEDIDSIKDVRGFKIIRDGVGEIQFLAPVDITDFNVDSDVILEPCFVNFFPYLPSKKQKESKISGIAAPVRIRLEGVWPVSKSDDARRRISENRIEEAENYNQQLQFFCSTCHATFKFYDPLLGIFCFEIPDISFGPFEIPSGR